MQNSNFGAKIHNILLSVFAEYLMFANNGDYFVTKKIRVYA